MPANILLLQGPMGPFFRRLSRDLEDRRGAAVYKINFNAGDRLFYRGERTVDFRGTPEQWPDFLAEKIDEWRIDTIYLFGDTRIYHTLAREVVRRLSVRLAVFEEGYLRPHYVTLEEGGVNQRSSLHQDPGFYRNLEVMQEPEPEPFKRAYCHAAWYAMCYYVAARLGRYRFPHYTHHRSFSVLDETFLWLRSAARKYRYRFLQRGILGKLRTDYDNKYYLVPLQVHCDGQIRACRSVVSAAAFIRRVVRSFARNAPAGTLLVLKHHPLCRGYSDYTRLIQKLGRLYGCEDRLLYVHDQHLPTLIKHAIGTVVVNSTVGLSSLYHNTPVIALGHAVYNMQGLTFQGELDDFWRAPGKVDQELNRKFRSHLLMVNQINGNFYKRPVSKTSKTGMDVQRLVIQSPGYVVQKDSVTEAPAAWANINFSQAGSDGQVANDAAVFPEGRDPVEGQAGFAKVPGGMLAEPARELSVTHNRQQ